MRFLVIAFLISGPAHTSPEWVEAPVTRHLPGQEQVRGKTYFDAAFSKRSGTFRAMYDSILDDRKSVSGEFLVGRFRYRYESPIPKGGPRLPKHDEEIMEVVMDCSEHLSGTLSVTYKLKGVIMLVEKSSDDEVLMTQTYGPSTTNDLCEFAKRRQVTP